MQPTSLLVPAPGPFSVQPVSQPQPPQALPQAQPMQQAHHHHEPRSSKMSMELSQTIRVLYRPRDEPPVLVSLSRFRAEPTEGLFAALRGKVVSICYRHSLSRNHTCDFKQECSNLHILNAWDMLHDRSKWTPAIDHKLASAGGDAQPAASSSSAAAGAGQQAPPASLRVSSGGPQPQQRSQGVIVSSSSPSSQQQQQSSKQTLSVLYRSRGDNNLWRIKLNDFRVESTEGLFGAAAGTDTELCYKFSLSRGFDCEWKSKCRRLHLADALTTLDSVPRSEWELVEAGNRQQQQQGQEPTPPSLQQMMRSSQAHREKHASSPFAVVSTGSS